MKKIASISFFLIMIITSQGQVNLVPNGDFEQFYGCPNNTGQIDSLLFWIHATSGYPGADYFNRCAIHPMLSVPYNYFGAQEPLSGNVYSGFVVYNDNSAPNYREYIEVPLKKMLEPNTCYHIEMHVSLADKCQFTSGDIGAFFSDSIIQEINNLSPLPYVPQFNNSSLNIIDTLKWKKVEGDIIAKGKEQFLIIGNFKDNLSTATIKINPFAQSPTIFFYIDNVSLYKCGSPIKKANIGNDKYICQGDKITLTMQYYTDYNYRWYDNNGVLLDTTNLIIVSPDSTSKYVLWVKDFAYNESYDTVTVFVYQNCKGEVNIPNVFTPNRDGHNDNFIITGEEISSLSIVIYNRWGKQVFETNNQHFEWDGTIKGEPAAAGVYYYLVEVVFTNGEKESRKGTVTLIR